MSLNLSREIKKLEKRLSECRNEEEVFFKYMENCINKFEVLELYLKLDPKKETLTT